MTYNNGKIYWSNKRFCVYLVTRDICPSPIVPYNQSSTPDWLRICYWDKGAGMCRTSEGVKIVREQRKQENFVSTSLFYSTINVKRSCYKDSRVWGWRSIELWNIVLSDPSCSLHSAVKGSDFVFYCLSSVLHQRKTFYKHFTSEVINSL